MRRLIFVHPVRPGKRKFTAKSGDFINFMLKCNYQIVPLDLEQSIQEWTKQNLWKTAFKKFSLAHS